jgi:hypothetical protein
MNDEDDNDDLTAAVVGDLGKTAEGNGGRQGWAMLLFEFGLRDFLANEAAALAGSK